VTTKVGVVSLGCSKNTVDTENMLGLLSQSGYQMVSDEREADVLLVNTCSFIDEAQRESIRTILDLGTLSKKLIVTGCLVQRHKGDLLAELPEVDAVIGTSEFHKIVDVVGRVQSGERFAMVQDKAQAPVSVILPRLLTTIGPSAYLKISEGCDHACTFCIIPQLRGRYASRPMDTIIDEAKMLTEGGVKEIVLIAEDTTRYGQEKGGGFQFPRLLERLSDEVPGAEWIRVLYAYPNYMSDELLTTMARLPKVVPYVDMPLQHTHPDILKAMRRPRHEPVDELIHRMRDLHPNLVIRTTFITGFPTETEEHHAHMLESVRTLKLDHVGAFSYSPQTGTPGATMKPAVPKRERDSRRNAVMREQQAVSLAIHQSLVGKVLPMLVEGVETDTGRLVGRTHRDAPEIDGTTFATSLWPVFAGEIVPVRITGAEAYDLHGEVVTP